MIDLTRAKNDTAKSEAPELVCNLLIGLRLYSIQPARQALVGVKLGVSYEVQEPADPVQFEDVVLTLIVLLFFGSIERDGLIFSGVVGAEWKFESVRTKGL